MANENLLPIWGLLSEDEKYLVREALGKGRDATLNEHDTTLMFTDREYTLYQVTMFQARTISLINDRIAQSRHSGLVTKYDRQLPHYATLLEKLRGTAADVQAVLTHSQPADRAATLGQPTEAEQTGGHRD